MRYFEKIARYNVENLEDQLDAQPELWNVHGARVKSDAFAGTSDIWVRFRDPHELQHPRGYLEQHFPIWYPAWEKLPALKPIVFDLMARERATHLGGILITRIPPHGKIKPHSDRGGWHAEHYKRKAYVVIKTNDRCVNHCEDECVIMRRGDAWYFNNLVTHRVDNDGDTERVTLIVCMRTE